MSNNIKQELIEKFGLVETDFDYHESDLYVKYSPEIDDYLKEMFPLREYFKEKENQENTWIDLPFQNSEYWERRLKK